MERNPNKDLIRGYFPLTSEVQYKFNEENFKLLEKDPTKFQLLKNIAEPINKILEDKDKLLSKPLPFYTAEELTELPNIPTNMLRMVGYYNASTNEMTSNQTLKLDFACSHYRGPTPDGYIEVVGAVTDFVEEEVYLSVATCRYIDRDEAEEVIRYYGILKQLFVNSYA